MLEEYAAKNNFLNVRHFSDDGHSGVNFDRPAWKQLIAEIEAGNVGIVLAKDLSRVGRDYLQTGFYTEVFFREKGVRFIAIANNIDSANSESAEFAPFLNIMSEWYARDNSRKLKAAFRAKAKSGRRSTSKHVYGYLKDPSDKTKWIVDEEVAPIIRRIFQMTIDGKGPSQIAEILMAEKIERPGFHMTRIGVGDHQWVEDKYRYEWNSSTVAKLISRQEYAGHTVNLRTEKVSYKDKNVRWKPQEEWLIFENTHEPIISQETWDTAQKCRRVKRRYKAHGEANPLTGLLLCKDCGRRMYNHRGGPHTTTSKTTGKVTQKKAYDKYTCSLHQIHRNDCSMHHISTASVKALILEAIQRATTYARNNEAEFVKIITEASAIQQGETLKSHKRQITKNEQRIAELDTLFRKTYEDFSAGRLTEKRFAMLSDGYETEQETLEKETVELKTALEQFDNDSLRADKFLTLAQKYTDFPELSAQIIHEFVDKVLVHEATKINGKREQQVDIYLNFIGQFAPPMTDSTQSGAADQASDVDAEDEEKRAMWREYKRNQRAKKKQAGQKM